jgi:hypothetical protein
MLLLMVFGLLGRVAFGLCAIILEAHTASVVSNEDGDRSSPKTMPHSKSNTQRKNLEHGEST